MESVSEDLNTEAKLGVTPNLAAPNTRVESRAVECFAALEAAERDFKQGREFGEAAIELRAEIKASGARSWMERLEQLGISYEKARYWIAKVKERPTDRHKPASAEEPAKFDSAAANKPLPDWDTKLDELKRAVDQVHMLGPGERNDAEIKEVAADLAEIVGCRLVAKGEDDA